MGRIRGFIKRHSMAVGFAMGSLTAGTLTGLYALHLTIRRLESVLDPSVTKLKKQAQYIYVENLGFDEYPDKPPWEDRNWEAKTSPPLWTQWLEKRTKGLYWRLLEIISTSEDEQEKLRTLKILKSHNLGDSDFQHLAQLCDSRTAAFLAREPDIDTRFFLTPPKRKECNNKNCLLDRFHDLFVELKNKSNHWCLRYFVSKMFRHANWFRELEYYVFEFITSPLEINNENSVKMCVESLLHHVMITEDNIHAMVEARGLEVLLDACRLVPDSLELKLMAVKILMRVSSDYRYLRDIHVTGWMKLLVEWSYECDQRLSAPAASALANLDRSSERGGCCYKSEVCLLHPLHRETISPDVDVIIVHGLLGSVHSTWRQRIWDIPTNLGLGGIVQGNIDDVGCSSKVTFHELDNLDDLQLGDDYEFVLADIPESESEPILTDVYTIPCSDPQTKPCGSIQLSQCWPKDWLPRDHTRIKILGVDYLSRISDWTNWCPFRHSEEKAKLSVRSKAIMEQLIDCGVGRRPIIWIGHSMGGLIIKHILTHALEQNCIEHERLLKNTKHVFFLGTPHLGSPLASIRKYLVPLSPSVETRELELNSPELLQLHNKFGDLVQRLGVKVVTFLETKGAKLSVPPLEWELSCVAPMPSDSGTGVIYHIPVGHMDIAKLSTRMSFIYIKILDAIKQASGPDFDPHGFLPTNLNHKPSADDVRIDHDPIHQPEDPHGPSSTEESASSKVEEEISEPQQSTEVTTEEVTAQNNDVIQKCVDEPVKSESASESVKEHDKDDDAKNVDEPLKGQTQIDLDKCEDIHL